MDGVQNSNQFTLPHTDFPIVLSKFLCGHRQKPQWLVLLEAPAGLEPVIAAVKELCPNHLDEGAIYDELKTHQKIVLQEHRTLQQTAF